MTDLSVLFDCPDNDRRIAGIILGITDIVGKQPDERITKDGKCKIMWKGVNRKMAFDISETLAGMQRCYSTSIGPIDAENPTDHQ